MLIGAERCSPGFFRSTPHDELMSATANVTDGLRRTRQLMEQELEKSSLSAQMLGEQPVAYLQERSP
jgi:hypothetical protein